MQSNVKYAKHKTSLFLQGAEENPKKRQGYRALIPLLKAFYHFQPYSQ